MKKSVFILLLMWSFALAVQAEKTPIVLSHTTADTSKFDMDKDRYVGVIDVVFDSDSNTLEVTGDSDIEAELYVYDSAKNVVNYSSSINSTLSLTGHGTYTLYIAGDGWYAEGQIKI